jgi:hypothetical protein
MDKLTTATHDYNMSLWINRIKECRASGLTVNRWCEQNNIGLKNYYYWMRKIKREAFDALPAERKEYATSTADSAVPVFTKIDLVADNRINSAAGVIIKLNGIEIVVQDGASETVIRNTLLAIRSLC